MSNWVSSWLNGNKDPSVPGSGTGAAGEGGEEEKKSEEQVVPSAEEIRRKRLERLKKLEEESTISQASALPTTTTVTSSTTNNVNPPPKQPSPPKVDPTHPKAVATSTTTTTINSTSEPLPVKKKSFTSVSQRPFLHDFLQRILRVTLIKEEEDKYLYLEDVVSSADLSAENLSEVLYSRLIVNPVRLSGKADHPLAVIQYLEECYHRCREEIQNISSSIYSRQANEEQKKQAEECLVNLQEMCINYAATCLTEPQMFPFEVGTIQVDAFERLIRLQPHAITQEFIERVVTALDQNDETAVFELFAPIFQKLIAELFMINPPSLMANFYPNIHTLTLLCRLKPLAQVFTRIPGFLLDPIMHGSGGTIPLTGRRLQDATAMGILLRFCTDLDPEAPKMFGNITKRTQKDVDNSIHTLRIKMTSIQEANVELIKYILKAGGIAREQVIKWFEQAMEFNVERTKENPNLMAACTSGMFLNLTMVLLRLCGPFLPPENSKKSFLINVKFLQFDNQLFPQDSTKLVGFEEFLSNNRRIQMDQLKQVEGLEEFNFITKCYFITARAIHLGPIAMINQYMRMLRQLSFLQNRLGDLNDPNADPRMKAHFEAMVAQKMLMDAALLHPDLVHEMIRFALLSCIVLRNLLNDHQTLSLPLPNPNKNDLVLANVPEHFVEDICSVFIFIARISPKNLAPFGLNLEDLLTLILILLSSPSYVKSPHLRAKMSEILFYVFLPPEAAGEGSNASADRNALIGASTLLTSHTLAQEHLAPCLLALYGDVEQTGFYEKLEHRYHIACLLKYLWTLPTHHGAFVKIAQDQENFVKFAHGLMNHINSLVTDALTSLPEIKSLQEEMQDVANWMRLDETTREQKQSLLADKERTVTSSLALANETIHMLSYLTSEKEIQQLFFLAELEERLVSMLNSVLVKLAGPRGVELKVNNPENYHFRPKEMLKEIVETFLHCAHEESFQQAVAVNGFYDAQVFQKCSSILYRTQLLPAEDIVSFETFVNVVAAKAAANVNMEEMLGDIPEEFLDPLVCTIMQDPVTLSTSGYTIDRSVITQHLLNDQTDPFTRAPLTMDQLVPNTELKEKIQRWMEQQTAKRK